MSSNVLTSNTALNAFVDDLTRLASGIHSNKKPPKEILEKLKTLASSVGLLLPLSDSTVTEIDDLLYPNDDVPDVNLTELGPMTIDESANAAKIFIMKYIEIAGRIEDRTLENASLKFIERFSLPEIDAWELWMLLLHLLISNRHIKICRALKLLKVAFNYEKICLEVFLEAHEYYDLAAFLWKLKHFPQATHPDKARITSWIRSQASALFENFPPLKNDTAILLDPDIDCLKYCLTVEKENLDIEHIQFLMDTRVSYDYFFATLHTYLTSSPDADQRLFRIKKFFKYFNCSRGDLNLANNSSMVTCLMEKCKPIIQLFHEYVEFSLETTEGLNALLYKLDKIHNYDFEPFLHEDKYTGSNDLTSEEPNFKESYTKKARKSFSKKEEADDTFEKYLIYDDCMKILEVMHILYSACSMKEKIFEGSVCSDPNCLFINMFQDVKCVPIKEYLIAALCYPRRKIPWVIKKTLEKCPFMFLSENQQLKIEGLLKSFKGEEMDAVTKEHIYFELNHKSFERGMRVIVKK